MVINFKLSPGKIKNKNLVVFVTENSMGYIISKGRALI